MALPASKILPEKKTKRQQYEVAFQKPIIVRFILKLLTLQRATPPDIKSRLRNPSLSKLH